MNTTFKCKKCKNEKELSHYTIKLVDGELITPEAYCENCDTYMKDSSVFGGFGKALMKHGKARGRKDYNR